MKYKQYNDYELVYMVRENELSKDLLYKKYQPLLRKISDEFYRQYNCYGCDYHDFLQEANIAFEKAIINYDDSKDSLFYSFVDLCVRRRMITFCRNISNTKRNIASYYYIDISENPVPDYRNDISELMDNYDINKMIREIIYTMSLEYSSVLELKLNGFTYREISILLNAPSSTIEYRIRKIRKEISKYYCKEAI